MPVYSYKCQDCGYVWDSQREMDRRHDPLCCPECCTGNGKLVITTAPTLAWSPASAEGGRPDYRERRRNH